MSNKTASKSDPKLTDAQIRRAAVVTALVMWGYGTVLGLCYGRTSSQAVSDAAAAAISGLLAALTYHIVSGNYKLFYFVIPLMPMIQDRRTPFWGMISFALIYWVPMAALIGLLQRRRKRPGGIPGSADPLFDANVDQSAGSSVANQQGESSLA